VNLYLAYLRKSNITVFKPQRKVTGKKGERDQGIYAVDIRNKIEKD